MERHLTSAFEKISKSQIKIGIKAPKEVVIAREEVVKEENVL